MLCSAHQEIIKVVIIGSWNLEAVSSTQKGGMSLQNLADLVIALLSFDKHLPTNLPHHSDDITHCIIELNNTILNSLIVWIVNSVEDSLSSQTPLLKANTRMKLYTRQRYLDIASARWLYQLHFHQHMKVMFL